MVLFGLVVHVFLLALHLQYAAGETIYPSTSLSMNDVNIFLTLLAEGRPFGFAHFNDGEIVLINVNNCEIDKTSGQRVADYGWQKCSAELGTAMRNALINTAPNFYVGIPCVCECSGKRTAAALEYLGLKPSKPISDVCSFGQFDGPMAGIQFNQSLVAKPWLKDRLTVATVFINGNYRQAYDRMIILLQELGRSGNRTVHVVVGRGAATGRLPFEHKAIFAARYHAFDHNYTEMRTRTYVDSNFKRNDVVLIMLGPVGRILASEWTLLSSEITFIDLGSFFDSYLWQRNYPYKAVACNHKDDFQAADVPRPRVDATS
jgi:hypothetical protein